MLRSRGSVVISALVQPLRAGGSPKMGPGGYGPGLLNNDEHFVITKELEQKI